MNSIASQPPLGQEHVLDLNVDPYLSTGAHFPALRAADEAMQWADRQKSAGPSGRDQLFAHALERRGVFVWGDDGRVRASYHVMNDVPHVVTLADAVADALSEIPLDLERRRAGTAASVSVGSEGDRS